MALKGILNTLWNGSNSNPASNQPPAQQPAPGATPRTGDPVEDAVLDLLEAAQAERGQLPPRTRNALERLELARSKAR